MSRLIDALDARFDDLDEVKDVAEYGCSMGVGGFIYSNEIRKFFFEYEYEIEDLMSELYNDNYMKEITSDWSTVNRLINKIVWIVVEHYCQQRLAMTECFA